MEHVARPTARQAGAIPQTLRPNNVASRRSNSKDCVQVLQHARTPLAGKFHADDFNIKWRYILTADPDSEPAPHGLSQVRQPPCSRLDAGANAVPFCTTN